MITQKGDLYVIILRLMSLQ